MPLLSPIKTQSHLQYCLMLTTTRQDRLDGKRVVPWQNGDLSPVLAGSCLTLIPIEHGCNSQWFLLVIRAWGVFWGAPRCCLLWTWTDAIHSHGEKGNRALEHKLPLVVWPAVMRFPQINSGIAPLTADYFAWMSTLGGSRWSFYASKLVLRWHLGRQRCRNITGMSLDTSTLLPCWVRGNRCFSTTAKPFDLDLTGSGMLQEGKLIASWLSCSQEGNSCSMLVSSIMVLQAFT